MTQFEKATEKYPNGFVTLSKHIKSFCPTDLLENGKDDCEGDKEQAKCEHCWGKEYEVNKWIALLL